MSQYTMSQNAFTRLFLSLVCWGRWWYCSEDTENVVARKIWDPGSYSQIVRYHFPEKVPKGNDRALSSVPKFQKEIPNFGNCRRLKLTVGRVLLFLIAGLKRMTRKGVPTRIVWQHTACTSLNIMRSDRSGVTSQILNAFTEWKKLTQCGKRHAPVLLLENKSKKLLLHLCCDNNVIITWKECDNNVIITW